MSYLQTLKYDETIETEQDTLGGSSYQVLDSGIYKCTINTAYIQKAQSGALGLVVSLNTENHAELRQTFWMSSGDAKGNLNYFTNQKGQRQYLPGFLLADSLALLAAKKPLLDLPEETKVIKAWDYVSKSEVPTQVPMLMDLVGKEITVAVLKVRNFKQTKNSSGTYEETNEVQESNEIVKFFRAHDGKTTAEIRAQKPEASFIHEWREKWEGEVRDLTIKKKTNSNQSGASKGKSSGTTPASLFDEDIGF